MRIIRHTTDRKDGSQDERFSPGDAVDNREKICDKLGIQLSRLVFCDQKHTVNVKVVSQTDLSQNYLGSSKVFNQNEGIDGLVTNQKNIYLCILTADCLPVFFYDPTKEVVGIAHCGCKGMLKLLPVRMIEAMENSFGCVSKNIQIQAGPGIGLCCYNVDQAPDNRIQKFRKAFGENVEQNGYLDLRYALLSQLLALNIPAENIDTTSNCTCCNPDYFSYYREKPDLSGEEMSIVGIKDET